MKTQEINYFHINNIKINNIEKNINVIDYLESLGIKVPHYCYHQKLSVSGNCRMCLVELKNSPKPVVSCAMTLTNKMEIFTDSPLVKKARENVMEFLLLNHPLDCPICDQGGECDLQDQSMVFGTSKKRFFNYKRSVINKNLGPIVKTVMTRCIHCTKCVRFATEIAGVDDLGVFGRGYSSEIGTYVSKIFDSELSGNVIDICPVGALTSKPYSFVDRNWELSNISSIDFSDGFASNILISVKSESVITKIQPAYNKSDLSNFWISDKTRFSFDGMFSAERISKIVIKNGNKSKLVKSWEIVLEEIVSLIFFKNHLNKHNYVKNNLKILVENSLSIEILSLLMVIEKKYNFISINILEQKKIENDDENFLTTLDLNENNTYLMGSTFCLLIGMNTKLEASSLNLKLRHRFLKGNFKLYSISPSIDLTIPTIHLGSSLNILKSISTGNHTLCLELKKAVNPIIIYNSEIYKQKNSSDFFFSILTNIQKNLNFLYNSIKIFNMVNTSLSSSTSGILSSFSKLHDLNNSSLLCININFNNSILKKIVELSCLNYIKSFNSNILINQNALDDSYLSTIQSNYNLILPNTTFVENNSNYINTENILKKSVKSITFSAKNKNDFDILRKLFFLFEKNGFLNNKTSISYSYKNIFLFLKYSNLHYISIQNFKKTAQNLCFKKSKVSIYSKKTLFALKNKTHLNKLDLWLNDFYVGGKDLYSKKSKIMIECSKTNRINSTNFKFFI